MIWFLLVPFFAWLLFKGLVLDDDNYGLGNRVIGCIMTLLLTGVSFIAIGLWAMFLGLFFETVPTLHKTESLVAIRDKDGVQGQFFLGSGTIEGDTYYFYYTQLSDGGIEPGKLSASKTIKIYEEARTDAKLIIFEDKFTQEWAYFVAFPSSNSYEFRVPNGTVRRGFSM